ncbi:hypothetical protein GZL_07285 [Streptomyces sp. 769]|nr:hypothetical protein GZL_07285 [Streptomyces sp. 769]
MSRKSCGARPPRWWTVRQCPSADPDGHRIVVTEVPADHPLRYRP